ncbi:ABC transporter ATP-binding protein [Propionicicella superfundia]|uniref:ABC transporter ATP-binding protein n=1 Tax=Propionicicella superfundia TaxID=348582 RepID=UPI0004156C73|nr:ABC transporter ATP-binding protein [Propionicicella superfundia]
MTILAVEHLSVRYPKGALAVRDVGFRVSAGEVLALVGESGCGKSTVAKALLGGLPRGTEVQGSMRLGDTELNGAPAAGLRRVRGTRLGYVSQDPFGAMDPLWRVGANVAEAWRVKGARPSGEMIERSLRDVGIDGAAARARQYPHEWSGGMLQRAEIAAGSVWGPELVVADEPTAALDHQLADAIAARLRAAADALLLISHDLSLVRRHADRILVMYGGRIVEEGACRDVLDGPRHPYTTGLLAAIPRPGHGLPVPLEGSPPDLTVVEAGCSFAPRCAHRTADCLRLTPTLERGAACPVVNR